MGKWHWSIVITDGERDHIFTSKKKDLDSEVECAEKMQEALDGNIRKYFIRRGVDPEDEVEILSMEAILRV